MIRFENINQTWRLDISYNESYCILNSERIQPLPSETVVMTVIQNFFFII